MKLKLLQFLLIIPFYNFSQSITIDSSTPFAAVKNTSIEVNFNPPAGLTGPYTVDLLEFQEATTPFGSSSTLVLRETVNTITNSISLPIGNFYNRTESDGFGSIVKYSYIIKVYKDEPSNNNSYPIKIINGSKPILGLRNITSAYPSGATLNLEMLNGTLNPENSFIIKLFRNGIGTLLTPIYQPGARVGISINAINSFSVTLPTGLENANNYYIEVSSSSPADMEITNFFTVDNSIPLPITLINFEAKTTIQGNQLIWTTSSEKNFSHFEIQRSTEASSFETIDKVNANGNSSELNNYQFVDINLKNNTNYYRLKQVDLDGKYEYSKILFVKTESDDTLKVFPNPVADVLTIENNSNKSLSINLLDAMGRSHFQLQNANQNKVEMNLKAIAKGIYFLQINDGEKVDYRKIVLEK